MTYGIPSPRRPAAPPGAVTCSGAVRRWYVREFGRSSVAWGGPADGGTGVRLLTGVGFDVLELPAGAGHAVLRRLRPQCPVLAHGGVMRLLVAAGCADEVPGLLDWLEWGALVPDLVAVGAGGSVPAPPPPGWPVPGGAGESAVWLRPPCAGRPAGWALPAPPSLTAPGGQGTGPDLVRLVDAAATECHRLRLGAAPSQRWASSYA